VTAQKFFAFFSRHIGSTVSMPGFPNLASKHAQSGRTTPGVNHACGIGGFQHGAIFVEARELAREFNR
jgi:hypothetical protein